MQKTKPLPYQKIGIWCLINQFKGRALLADDMGLGKSIQSLYASMPLRRKRPIIVACPSSVKYSWEDQVLEHTNFDCWVLEGQKPERRVPKELPEVIIVNWDILNHWSSFLMRCKPGVLIGDEVQFIKNHRAIRSKAFRRIARKTPNIFCLSGTPIENRPIEFFNSLNILRPDLFPSRFKFGNMYCDPKVTPWGITYNGASNIPKLRRKLLRHVMIRRTLDEVESDLPPMSRTLVPLKIDMKKYKLAEKDIVRFMHRYKPDDTHKGTKMKQLAKMNYLLGLVSQMKVPLVIKWIKEFFEANPDEKLTVFGHHRKFLEAIHEEFKTKSVLVYGGITGRKRKRAIDAFASNDRIRLFVGGIRAAGTGINKLIAASHVVLGELVWVPAWLQQVEKRLHRIGQKKAVRAWYLIAKGTIEDALCKAIYTKEKMVKSILDGDFEKQEFDIMKKVFTQLKRKAA